MLNKPARTKQKTVLSVMLMTVLLPLTVFAQNLSLNLPVAPAGDVVASGNFIHIVENLDRTLAFYQDLLGAEPRGGTEPRAFGVIEQVAQMYDAVGAEFRGATIPVPNTALGMEFLEWRGLRRPVSRPAFYDYGAPMFLLFVKDIDLAIESVLRNGGTIATPTGEPVVNAATGSRIILVQDPDGYFIEILQLGRMPSMEAAGNVFTSRFRYTVADANETVAFYNSAFDFNLPAAGEFNDDAVLGAILGLEPAATSRIVSALVPGSSLTMELLELDVARAERIHQRLPARGSAIFRIFVRDLDISMAKALAAGAVLAPNNQQEIVLDNGLRMRIIEDLNGMLLQLIERAP